MLRRLILHTELTEFVLPKRFLDGDAPQLRHLELHSGNGNPASVLPSATSIVSHPRMVPNSVYFSPESLIAHIRTISKLYPLASSPQFVAKVSVISAFFHPVKHLEVPALK